MSHQFWSIIEHTPQMCREHEYSPPRPSHQSWFVPPGTHRHILPISPLSLIYAFDGRKNIWDQAHSTMPCALHCNLLFIFTGTSTILIYHGWFQVVVFEISHKCIYTFVAMSAMVFQGVHLQMCDKALPFLGKRHLHPHAGFPQELCSKMIANKQPCCGPFTVRNLKDLWRCWKK